MEEADQTRTVESLVGSQDAQPSPVLQWSYGILGKSSSLPACGLSLPILLRPSGSELCRCVGGRLISAKYRWMAELGGNMNKIAICNIWGPSEERIFRRKRKNRWLGNERKLKQHGWVIWLKVLGLIKNWCILNWGKKLENIPSGTPCIFSGTKN